MMYGLFALVAVFALALVLVWNAHADTKRVLASARSESEFRGSEVARLTKETHRLEASVRTLRSDLETLEADRAALAATALPFAGKDHISLGKLRAAISSVSGIENIRRRSDSLRFRTTGDDPREATIEAAGTGQYLARVSLEVAGISPPDLLERVNGWNASTASHGTTAVVTGSGESRQTVLTSALSMRGGVHPEYVRRWAGRFLRRVESFVQYMRNAGAREGDRTSAA